MKKIHALFICLLCFVATTRAQESGRTSTPGQTIFYAELGGAGILFSANIDKRFTKSHLGWGGRAGLGFISGYLTESTSGGSYFDDPSSVVTFPVQVNYIFGKSNSPHTFEAGGGFTVVGKKVTVLDNNKGSALFATASFMYRRQPVDGGFSWRIGFTPLIAKGYIQPLAGVSVGYSF